VIDRSGIVLCTQHNQVDKVLICAVSDFQGATCPSERRSGYKGPVWIADGLNRLKKSAVHNAEPELPRGKLDSGTGYCVSAQGKRRENDISIADVSLNPLVVRADTKLIKGLTEVALLL